MFNKRSKAKFIFTVVLLVTAVLCTMILPASAATLNIAGSTFTHDPSIIKVGSTWWQFYTANGIGLKYSSDGTTWTDGSPIFPTEPSWWKTALPTRTDKNVWAPDIFYYNGRYWLYYSISVFGKNTSVIGLASTTSITNGGTWRDDGLVIQSTTSNDYNCIDPCLTTDASGNLWMTFGSFYSGIKLIQINKSTMKPVSGAQIYSLATRPAVANKPLEAPYIVYNNGYYYLFVSFDYCCKGVNSTYKIAYGRSTSITGPYTDKNGVSMMNGGGTILDQSSGQWIGPGGQSIYKNGTQWLLVHHAYDANNNGMATLRIKELFWDSQKWPTYYPTSYLKAQNRGVPSLYIDNLGSTADGANVSQWSGSASYNQQWQIVNVDGIYYRIVNRTTGKCLDSMGRTGDGSVVGQWAASPSYNQQWEIIDIGGGYVKFKNRSNGLFLDNGGQTANGSTLKMWSGNASNNQQWRIVNP